MELDEAIIREYRQFCLANRTASDPIALTPHLREAFAGLINSRVPGQYSSEYIARRTISLRKAGKLPRAWNGHGKRKKAAK